MADNCGYWKYLGDSEAPGEPRVLTRAEKGQALTHLEMDVNLASLFHKLNTSSADSTFSESESVDDTYFNTRKPTREQEMAGLFATFSYAAVKQSGSEGEEILVQYPPQVVKVQHTTDEIRYKLADEQIPGYFDIKDDLNVTGSVVTQKDLRVAGTGSIDGDVYIKGNLYVHGVIFGNISQPEYNTPEYAQTYQEDTEEGQSAIPNFSGTRNYYTKAEVDQMLANLREELLREIHGA